jgi:hypothetical protein
MKLLIMQFSPVSCLFIALWCDSFYYLLRCEITFIAYTYAVDCMKLLMYCTAVEGILDFNYICIGWNGVDWIHMAQDRD